MGEKLILGCGYLGRRVAQQWLAQGHRVFALTRTPERAAELAKDGITPGVGDVLDPETLTSLIPVETVLYCVGFDRRDLHPMWEVHINGLRNVLLRLPPPQRFIYVSSTGVYGQRAAEWVDETSQTHPVVSEEAGATVLAAEELLRKYKPDAIILRFAGIYGPGRLLRRRALEEGLTIATDPQGWLNLIQVDDGVRAILAAEKKGQKGRIYNVCDDHPVQREEFYSYQAKLLNAPQPQFTRPPFFENNRRILNHRMRGELGVELQYPDYQKGLRASI